MNYQRMAIEKESPEELGYETIKYNLSESSVADRHVRDFVDNLDDVLLCYGDHRGDAKLRCAVAAIGDGLNDDNVLITAGASAALFIIATSLLEKGDHLVVIRPNYATNIDTPKAIGCEITYLDVTFEDDFRLDLNALRAAIRPETKYISVTYPHNPAGVMLSEGDLHRLIQIVEETDCKLLFDETYREMTIGEMHPVAASLSDKVISVSSLSKTYGIPGIRIGWLITKDTELMNLFLSAKEQINITGSMVDEHIANVALSHRKEWIGFNNARIQKGLALVRSWVERENAVEWVAPSGGCVCFPRIKLEVDIDLDDFYEVLYEKYQTYVGAGHWFEMSDRHFRIGFAWPTLEELEVGLGNISKAIADTRAA